MFRIYFLLIILFLSSCQKDDELNEEESTEFEFLVDGGDDIVNLDMFQVQLDAESLRKGETGKWKIASGLIDNFVFLKEENNPKSTFNGLPGEEYKLVWSVKDSLNNLANDTVTVRFKELFVEIEDISLDFYQTRRHLVGTEYHRGKWTVNKAFNHFWNQNPGGRSIPDDEGYEVVFFGNENTEYSLTWTAWYGSVSNSATINFSSSSFHQYEALEDLMIYKDPSTYELDEDGNVVKINLHAENKANNFLYLDRNPSVQVLTHLKWLSISSNRLFEFPSIITSYTNLEYLDATGNGYTELPDNFGDLKKMDSLFLDHPQFGSKVKELPESFGNLENLRYLELAGLGLENLPESFSKLTSLKYLDLDDNLIEKFPENIGDLKNLEILRGPGTLKPLPRSFSGLESLRFCFFTSYGESDALPVDIGNLQNLETFWFDGNFKSIPESLFNIQSLKNLKINGNLLKNLPENIGNLKNLTDLSLFGKFEALPQSIGDLENLENLIIKGTLEELPESVSKLKNLEWLVIENLGLKKLPQNLGNMSKLKYIKASVNKLTYIPESIGELNNIFEIDFNYNDIVEFPDSMGNLSNSLYNLFIRGNNYSDEEFEKLKISLPSTQIYRY